MRKPPFRRAAPLRHQQGSILLSVMILLVVMTFLSMLTANNNINRALHDRGQAMGRALQTVNSAAGLYLLQHYDALLTGAPIAGIANPAAPSVDELKAIGILGPGTNSLPPFGGAYRLQVVRLPAGCSGAACNLQSHLWITQPIQDPLTGAVDIRVLSGATGAMEGYGGYSQPQAPSVIQGAGWSFANPEGQKPGVLAAINGYQSAGWAMFVRKRDTEDPQLRGKLTVDGTVTANSDLRVAGDFYPSGVAAAGAACTASGAVRRNSANTNTLVMCSNSKWQPVGISAGDVAAGGACAGSTVVTDSSGTAYMCRSGKYVPMANLISRNVEVGRYLVVDDSSTSVPVPNCPGGGTPNFRIEARGFGVDLISASGPYTSVRFTADPSPNATTPTAWIPRIFLTNLNNVEKPSTGMNLSAVFITECQY